MTYRRTSRLLVMILTGLLIGPWATATPALAAVALCQLAEPGNLENDVRLISPPVISLEPSEPTPVIDVMVLYTSAAKENAGGEVAIQECILQAVEFANQVYANSKIPQSIRLVHMEERTDFVKEADLDDQVEASEDIRKLRSAHGADLVSVWMSKITTTIPGVVYGLANSPTEEQLAGGTYSTIGKDNLVSLVRVDEATSATAAQDLRVRLMKTFVHELGHNMGAGHDKQFDASGNEKPAPRIYDDSYAYLFSGLGNDSSAAFTTIMTELNSCGAAEWIGKLENGKCPRIKYFSNPDRDYNGVPTGSYSETNNARALTETGPAIAALRPKKKFWVVEPWFSFVTVDMGVQGSEWTPDSMTYTVRNPLGSETIQYIVSVKRNFDFPFPDLITVNGLFPVWAYYGRVFKGTLGPGGSETFIVDVAPGVTDWAAGTYSTELSFLDQTHSTITTRRVVVTVPEPGRLDDLGTNTISAVGPVGNYKGITPGVNLFYVSNGGGLPVNLRVSTTAPWITLYYQDLNIDGNGEILAEGPAVAFPLPPLTSSERPLPRWVKMGFNEAANDLPVGTYTAVVNFDNLTNSLGSTKVTVTLELKGGVLSVTPATDVRFEGPEGGPFTSQEQVYTLSNTGVGLLRYEINQPQSDCNNWFRIGGGCSLLDGYIYGTLAAGAQETVRVVLGGGAQLAAGTYTDTITFTNELTGDGTTSRTVTLVVTPAIGVLSVTPATDVRFEGPEGGPFTSQEQVYTLSNTGVGLLRYEINQPQSDCNNWFRIGGGCSLLDGYIYGTLAAGAQETVRVVLGGGAQLAAGTYTDTITFTNELTGDGTTSRTVTLVVTPKIFARAISSPTPGATLTSTTATFTGGHASGELQHYLYVGTTKGSYQIKRQNLGTAHSATVSNLPMTGTIYVRYWTRFSSGWKSQDQTYTMNVPVVAPKLTAPSPGATLSSTTVTFTGGHASGELQHYLYVGTTKGSYQIKRQNLGTAHSATVSNLPMTGTIYVRYWTRFSSGWKYQDHTYTTPTTIYEDAENSNTAGWQVYDATPAGATIANVYDATRQSRVIAFTGSGRSNGYKLYNSQGQGWNNTRQFVVEWSMAYAESFTVYLSVQTTAGHRYIYYNSANTNNLGTAGYVHHGLGRISMWGQWRTFTRDLQADLTEAQPGVQITKVNAFLIRGSGRVDDIRLHTKVPSTISVIPSGTRISPVHLQASNGQYVVAEGSGGGAVNANRSWALGWETFTLIDINGGSLMSGDSVHFQTFDGEHYFVAEGGGGREVKADRTVPLSWETFIIRKVGGSGAITHGDPISLQANNGQYMVAEGGGGGVVNANRDWVLGWERFTYRNP